MIRTAREHSRDERLEADACIVGSGAGGAALAATLAARGLRVVVLEEGGYFRSASDFTASPLEMQALLYRERGMTAALGVPGIPIPLGRCLGGTTTVNSGTCFRAPDRVVDSWRSRSGLREVTPEALAPFFERVEREVHVAAPPLERIGRNGILMHRGAEALGLHGGVLRRNAKGCRGSGVCAFGCPTDGKQSTLVSYIPRASERGATILADCRAERVLLEGGRAAGIEAWTLDPDSGDPAWRVTVRAPVVAISCGTIITPSFLAQNRLLRGSGQLGRGLHIHPAVKVLGLFDEDVVPWEGVPQSYYVDHYKDRGILLESIAVPPGLGAMTIPLLGREHARVMAAYRRVGAFGVMVSDSSSGEVRRVAGRPIITYRLNRNDARRLVFGAYVLARIAFAAGARVVWTPIHGVPPLRSEREARRILERPADPEDLEVIAFHPLGTCRMGADPRRSVVSGTLESHEVPGLYVVDGSVFPTPLEVNPQLSIMTLAVRAGELIADRLAH